MYLSFNLENHLANQEDISDYIISVNTSITACDCEIGNIKISAINFADLLVAEEEPQHLDNYSEYLGKIVTLFPYEMLDEDFIYIDSMLIRKEFRGYNLGAHLFFYTMKMLYRISDYKWVITLPFLPQISGYIKDDFSDLPSNQGSLINMYKKWGFKRYKGSEFYYLELNEAFFETYKLFHPKLPKDKENKLENKLLKRIH